MRISALAVLAVLASAPSSFRVQVTGHGRPMILIPGMASSGDTWKSTVAHYDNQYTGHVLTLAGFAGVPATDRPLLATAATELAEYSRQQGLDNLYLVVPILG